MREKEREIEGERERNKKRNIERDIYREMKMLSCFTERADRQRGIRHWICL